MSKSLDRLTLLSNFARIAERGSISAAARDQNLSQASASRQLAALETQLGVQLIHRTTHALALTKAGQDCLQEARILLDGWEVLTEKVGDTAIGGALKIIAPVALGQKQLARAALSFQQAHPGIRLTWLLDDAPIRFSEIGCDLWIKVGAVPDNTLIVQPLGQVERLIVAAPALMSRKPATPNDLNALPCAALAPFEGGKVPLHNACGDQVTITPPVAITTNNIFAAHQAALTGLGFAVMPKWFVADDLATGALIDILSDWRAPSLTVNAAFLPAQRQTQRLRLFRDHIAQAITAIDGVAVP